MKNAPFMKIPDAAKASGLSMYYLRKACREGTVPYIRPIPDGPYLVNVPRLLEQLDAESLSQARPDIPLRERDGEGVRA